MLSFFQLLLFSFVTYISFCAPTPQYPQEICQIPLNDVYPQILVLKPADLEPSQISCLESFGLKIDSLTTAIAAEVIFDNSNRSSDSASFTLSQIFASVDDQGETFTQPNVEQLKDDYLGDDIGKANNFRVSRMEAGGGLAIGIVFTLLGLILVSQLARVCSERHRVRINRRMAAVIATQANIADDLYGRQIVEEQPFAENKFSSFHGHFTQTSCTICLDDFSADTVCTQLTCEHLYHSPCIGEWLQRHETCPNCNTKMTKGSIAAYLESSENQQAQPINHPVQSIAIFVV